MDIFNDFDDLLAMEPWINSMVFEVCCQIFESPYHLLFTSVLYHSFQDRVEMIYINYVDVFIYFVGCEW